MSTVIVFSKPVVTDRRHQPTPEADYENESPSAFFSGLTWAIPISLVLWSLIFLGARVVLRLTSML